MTQEETYNDQFYNNKHLIKITGTIVRRRCLGKHLAFADIQLTSWLEPANDEKLEHQVRKNINDIIKVAFRRSSPSWNTQDDTNVFPTKNSSLPHGATVAMSLCYNYSMVEGSNVSQNTDLEVSKWEIITHPHDIAIKHAKGSSEKDSCTNGNIHYSDYMKIRGELFYQFSINREKYSHKETPSKEPSVKTSVDVHGNNPKGLRSKVFASWIIQTFGCDLLKEGNGLLDIAGGKGQLSIELAIKGQIPCTIIDPMVRSSMFKKKEMKRLKKANSPIPIHIPERFILNKDNYTTSDNIIANMGDYSCFIGLHADECTEDIVDAALHYKKSLAIVPCCVFPSFFPMRRLRNDRFVNSYDEFLCYLLEKDERLCRATLDFEGKNQVIYLKQF